MKRTKWLIVAAIIAVVAIGGSALSGHGKSAADYRTDKVTRGNIAEIVSATGTLNPIELITVGSQVSGQIEHIYVNLNDKVKKGQMLADIDPSLTDAQLKQAEAGLETAKISYEQSVRDLKRTQMLLKKDYVAQVDLEHAQQAYVTAKSSYEVAKMQVEQSRVTLSYTKITSPIDGEIIAQSVTSGQTLAATLQTPDMFKIASDLKLMKIDVNLSESDINKIKVGMPVSFTVDAFPDRQFPGKVTTVNLNPNNQQGVVTYTITVSVENKLRELFPGMTSYVNITLSEVKNVLRVPASALRFEPPPEEVGGLRRLLGYDSAPRQFGFRSGNDDSKRIYILRNGQPVPIQVKTGATDETYVEISGDGVADGDTVVIGMMPHKRN